MFSLAINTYGQDCQLVLSKVTQENTKLREMNLKLVTDYNQLLKYQKKKKKSDSIMNLLEEINSKLDNRPSEFNAGMAVNYYQENLMNNQNSIGKILLYVIFAKDFY